MYKIILACLTLTGFTHAAAIISKLETVEPSLYVSGTVTGGGDITIWAGKLVFDKFDAFCSDPFKDIAVGDTVSYVTSNWQSVPHGETTARIIAMYLGSNKTPMDAAAAQWAIWKELENDGSDFGTGAVRITSNQSELVAMASQYLQGNGAFQPASVLFLESATKQDMVAFNFSISAVPEPTPTALLLCFLVTGFSLTRNRKH